MSRARVRQAPRYSAGRGLTRKWEYHTNSVSSSDTRVEWKLSALALASAELYSISGSHSEICKIHLNGDASHDQFK